MLSAAVLICLAALVTIAAFTDLRERIIPNALTLPTMLAGLALGWMSGDPLPHVLGLGIGLLPGVVMWHHGSLGGGDVKLFGAIGALAGPMFVMLTWILAFAVALASVVVKALRAGVFLPTVRILFMAAFAPVSPRVRADFELPFDEGHAMPLAPAIAVVALGQIAVMTW